MSYILSLSRMSRIKNIIKNIKIRQGRRDYLTKKFDNAKGIAENYDVNEQKN